MARRRAKKTTRNTTTSPLSNICGNDPKEQQFGDNKDAFQDQEVERQSAAIRALCDVENKRLLTGLRLLRSYFNKDQLQTPVLQYFTEHLPNLAHVGIGKDGKYEVQWKEKDDNLYMGQADGENMHAYLLHQMSMAYPDYSTVMPSLGGCEFSTKTVKTRLPGADNLEIGDFNLEETSDTQMLGMHDSLRTPGAYSQRLSVGMTPKTRRVPKHGEMLLSVHGSPLGVYKEDMDSIHVFEYDPELHNFFQVSGREYHDCTAEQAFNVYNGTTSVPLMEHGVIYFVCTILNYCSLGQKLMVAVNKTPPASPPVAAPLLSPAPSPFVLQSALLD